ncbi:MAG: hypothetical protein U0168_32270 [Nannocystaceae bacterium]
MRSAEDVLLLQHEGNTDFAAMVAWRPDLGNAVVVLNAGTPLSATFAAALSRIGVVGGQRGPAVAADAAPAATARATTRIAVELAGEALSLRGAGSTPRCSRSTTTASSSPAAAARGGSSCASKGDRAARPGRYASRQPLTAPTPPAAP